MKNKINEQAREINYNNINLKYYCEKIQKYEKSIDTYKKQNIKNNKKIKKYESKIKSQKNLINKNKKEILKIKNSNSWKITKPLRLFAKAFKNENNGKSE
ncbi:hypothetical protein [Methanobrevibacter arboriphilus]|uniref:hypothetical protein n=1 Tax=Methanobrevibacter arboriphilus TaxID=39441 RepID=UPI0006D0AE0A|nr:hypothetical protein [Methanobrevibacter arboriphilus]